MKKYMIYALAACMTFVGAGCSKDFEDAGAQQTPVVEGKYRLPSLSASLDDDDAETRTGEPNATTGAVNWGAKDRILIVNTTNWSTWQYELVKGANSPIGEFEPIIGGTEASSDDPNFSDLVAVYPVSAAYVENGKLSFKINQNWYPEDEAAKTALKERLEGMGIKSWTKDTPFSFKENDIKVSYKCTPTATDKKVNSANFKFRQLGAWCKFEFDFSTDENYAREKLLRIAVSTVDGTTKFTGEAEVDLTTDPNNPTLKTSGDGTEIDWTFNSGSNMTTAFTRSLMLYPGELSNQRLKIVAETTLHTFTFYATPKQPLKAGTVFHFPISLGFKSFGENDVDAAASKELAYTVTDKAQLPFYYYGGTNCYIAMNGTPVTVKCTPYKTDAYFHNTGTKVTDAVLGADYTPTDAKLIWYESALGAEPTISDFNTSDYSFKVTMPSGKYGNALVGVYNAAGKILWSYHIWAPEDDPTLAVDPENPKAMKLYENTYSGAYTVMPMNLGATKVGIYSGTAKTPADIASVGLWYQWGRKDPLGRLNSWTTTTNCAVDVAANAVPDISAYTNSTSFFSDINDGANNLLNLPTILTEAGYMKEGELQLNVTEIDGKSVDRFMIEKSIANPTKHINVAGACKDQWMGQVNNYLWGNPKGAEYPRMSQTYKSIFDPCPDGYRVAPKDLWLNFTFSLPTAAVDKTNGWNIDFQDYGSNWSSSIIKTYKGYNFYIKGSRDTDGNFPTGDDVRTDFYSTTGFRDPSGKPSIWANYIGMWNSAPCGMLRADETTVSPLNTASSAYVFGIRCVKEPTPTK